MSKIKVKRRFSIRCLWTLLETKTLENIFRQLATDRDRDVKMVVQGKTHKNLTNERLRTYGNVGRFRITSDCRFGCLLFSVFNWNFLSYQIWPHSASEFVGLSRPVRNDYWHNWSNNALEWIEEQEWTDYQDDDEDLEDEEDDVIQHLTPEELDDMVQNLNNSESEDLSYKPLVSVVSSSLTILSRPSPKSRLSAP